MGRDSGAKHQGRSCLNHIRLCDWNLDFELRRRKGQGNTLDQGSEGMKCQNKGLDFEYALKVSKQRNNMCRVVVQEDLGKQRVFLQM